MRTDFHEFVSPERRQEVMRAVHLKPLNAVWRGRLGPYSAEIKKVQASPGSTPAKFDNPAFRVEYQGRICVHRRWSEWLPGLTVFQVIFDLQWEAGRMLREAKEPRRKG